MGADEMKNSWAAWVEHLRDPDGPVNPLLAAAEHLDRREGSEREAPDRVKQAPIRADLYDDLRQADLRQADLRAADLRDADLRHADLRHADLRMAYLRDADLRDADLRGANLRGAYMTGATLHDAVVDADTLNGAALPEELMVDEVPDGGGPFND